MAELEYNHLATVIVLFGSVENHQWMIHICIIPSYLLTGDLVNHKGQNSDFTVETPSRHYGFLGLTDSLSIL